MNNLNEKTTVLKVALTNLGKYNEGELIYEWLELPTTDEEIENAFKKIGVGNGTKYEEYFITDYETDFDGLNVYPYSNIREINEQAKELSNLKEYEIEEINAIIETQGGTLEQALETYKKGDYSYLSGIKSYDELAEMFVDEGFYGEIPEHLINYIDYEKIAQELENDYTLTKNGAIILY